jgi:twitching motility protein PilJ
MAQKDFIIKNLPLISVGVLSLGLLLFGGSQLGILPEFSFTSLLFYGGIFLTAVSAVFVGLSYGNLSKELSQAEKIAKQLAEGDLSFEIKETSGIKASLGKVSEYLFEKTAVTQQIAEGDLTANANPRSENDVFGQSLQNMVEQLRTLVQTNDERDHLQQSIMKLLEEVSGVAEGDLTVQAEVTPEMTGAIADAFNYMTAELRSLIRQVKEVTFQVSASAKDINENTKQLAEGSETQALQIQKTSTAIENMALQIHEVTNNAVSSAKVAGESLNTARLGSQAVQDNIMAMNRIRNQVQETAKRIKKLGERSQEISQIVQLIDDLSERTSLLALNASLQAAAAGEAGRGFVVVAEEVERLAERSNRATQQIGGLTQAIQLETKEVVASMEETIHEVVVGSALADKAGQALIEIEQVSQRLEGLIQTISELAKKQAASSEDISKVMNDISQVTELVNSSSKKAADSMRMLVRLADELRRSVAPFKLPEEQTGKLSQFSLPDASGQGFFLN